MSDKLIGKSLDDFQIEGTLGKGGMGVVYRATEAALHRQVAIKVLPDHLAENKSFIARFHREARAVAQLNHPNVVTVYRVGQALGFHYIAMEYIKGGELKDLMKEEGQLSFEKSLRYVQQSASALNGAHTMGVLHRDIKPQNIMIDEHDRVKVMDFGIAKMMTPDEDVTALTMDGTLLGTPTHMSPEQCQGDAVDQRADIYALGIVLYQCLTGELPFRGETPLSVIQKILNDEVPDVRTLRPEIPAALAEIVKKATAKDREERYATAADFERDLGQCQKLMDSGGGDETRSPVWEELETRLGPPPATALVSSMTLSDTKNALHVLAYPQVSLGRKRDCTIVTRVMDANGVATSKLNVLISRLHATLSTDGSKAFLADGGSGPDAKGPKPSACGVWLDGKAIDPREPTALKNNKTYDLWLGYSLENKKKGLVFSLKALIKKGQVQAIILKRCDAVRECFILLYGECSLSEVRDFLPARLDQRHSLTRKDDAFALQAPDGTTTWLSPETVVQDVSLTDYRQLGI